MIIGLIIPNNPTESETFFKAKITFLEELGHKVILFTNQNDDSNICKTILNPSINKNIFLQIAKMFFSYVLLFLKNPKIFLRFLYLEKNDNVSIYQRWVNLYLNCHILTQKLDWIHFGFATMSMRRENTAAAMYARMGLSIRGYDLCIYPLKYPGCYNKVWEKVDKIHSISNELIEIAIENGLNSKVKYEIIYPAINTKNFQAAELNSKTIINKDKIHFLTVARLHWKKGLEYTLQALAKIKNQGIHFHYTIVGGGEEYERLVFATHELGLNNFVTFFGQVNHEYIKCYYEKADIYLQYSIQEGFCNSVLEAQGMGLLSIVSNAEGLSENVVNGQTGWIVPKRNPRKLAQQINNVLNMKEKELHQIRINAINRIKKQFNLEKQIQKFSKFFN